MIMASACGCAGIRGIFVETPLLQVIIPFAFELGIPRRGESRNTASANEILVTIAQSRVSELFEMFLGAIVMATKEKCMAWIPLYTL